MKEPPPTGVNRAMMGTSTTNGNRMTMPRIGNLRAYLAGTGATGALIAGAVVAFLSIGAFVAFDGFPLGGDDASGSVSLADQPGGTAPETAAAALGGAPGGVAATPAGGTVLAASLPALSPTDTGPGGTGTLGLGPGETPSGTGSGGGAVTDVVGAVDDSTGLNLSDTTSGLTNTVDQTVNNTLNNVGGLVGSPNLGDNVTNGVNNLTDNLLGGNGLPGGN
jgi:hypothetical protein